MSCGPELDWVAKLQPLQGYRDRDGLGWDDPRCGRSISNTATSGPTRASITGWRAGSPHPLLDDASVAAAVTDPPEDTRAWFRGECLEKFAPQVAAASWDSVIFDVPGRRALQRVPMRTPRGTRAHVGEIMDRSPDVTTLLRELDAAAG